jgi:hypothetical protein
VNNWNAINMAIIASVWAKTKAIIIPVKILGALEGLRPRALMLAKLANANTAEGPRMHKPKMMIIARFLLIP